MNQMKGYLKYSGILLFAFAIPLPVPLKIISICFIALLINLLLLRGGEKPALVIMNIFFILFFLFFFIDVVRSLFLPGGPEFGFREVKLPFLALPFLFIWKAQVLRPILKPIFISFMAGTIVYIVYAWGFAVYFYTISYAHYEFNFFDGYAVYLLDFHLPGAIHRAYIGIYLTFVALVVYYYTIVKKEIRYSIGIGWLVFYAFNIFYIGSKSAMFLFIFLIGVISVYAYRKDFNNKMLYRFIAVFIVLVIGGAVLMGKWLPASLLSSVEKRFVIYECDTKVAVENFAFGVGYNQVRASSALCPGYDGELMTHNMLFNELIANGIAGALILIAMFIYLTRRAILYENIILLCILCLFLFAGMVEDVLSRQWGVMFFVFFTGLLFIQQSQTKPVVSQTS